MSMTVKELTEELKKLPQDWDVYSFTEEWEFLLTSASIDPKEERVILTY